MFDELEYFSEFKLFDENFIFNYDISLPDYSLENTYKMFSESTNTFLSHELVLQSLVTNQSWQYLYDNGGFFLSENYTPSEIIVSDDMDVNELTEAVKEHMIEENTKLDQIRIVIIQAISEELAEYYSLDK